MKILLLSIALLSHGCSDRSDSAVEDFVGSWADQDGGIIILGPYDHESTTGVFELQQDGYEKTSPKTFRLISTYQNGMRISVAYPDGTNMVRDFELTDDPSAIRSILHADEFDSPIESTLTRVNPNTQTGANRVGTGIEPAPPTPPGMRVRTGRFPSVMDSPSDLSGRQDTEC